MMPDRDAAATDAIVDNVRRRVGDVLRDRAALLAWFDEPWRDESRTGDAKQQVLEALHRIGRPYAGTTFWQGVKSRRRV